MRLRRISASHRCSRLLRCILLVYQVRTDRYGDSTLGCTIKFGKDNSGNVGYLGKLSCLRKRVLAGGSVKDYQSFQICFRVLTFQNTVNFAKLLHKVLLIVKSSCCVADQNIRISGLGCCHRIIDNRCRVCTVLSADDLNTCTVSPLCQLFSCCRTERICRTKDYFLS